MTPEQIRTLRQAARKVANNARNVQTLANAYAFTVWTDGSDFEEILQLILSGDIDGLREARGPTGQEIREEAQRLKLDRYWSRASCSLKAELNLIPGSKYYGET